MKREDIKRYDLAPSINKEGFAEVEEVAYRQGDYVKYTDHKAVVETLQRENRGYIQTNIGLQEMVENKVIAIKSLQNKIEELESQLKEALSPKSAKSVMPSTCKDTSAYSTINTRIAEGIE